MQVRIWLHDPCDWFSFDADRRLVIADDREVDLEIAARPRRHSPRSMYEIAMADWRYARRLFCKEECFHPHSGVLACVFAWRDVRPLAVKPDAAAVLDCRGQWGGCAESKAVLAGLSAAGKAAT